MVFRYAFLQQTVVMEPEFDKADLETDHLCTEVLAVLSHELSTLLIEPQALRLLRLAQ